MGSWRGGRVDSNFGRRRETRLTSDKARVSLGFLQLDMAPKRARKPKTSEDDAVDYEEGAGESGEEYVEGKRSQDPLAVAGSEGGAELEGGKLTDSSG